jgi:Ni/Fe-hydrogenase subunit HybB-like protein
MLLSPGVRRSRRWLFTTCALIVGGVALNRINVFLVSYNPPYTQQSYFPSIGEMAVTAGLIASVIFSYRVAVTYLPVLSARPKEVSS